MEVLTPLGIAVFLATVANRLVEGLVVPIFEKLKWDRFWLLYVSWLVGFGLVFAANVNLFAGYVADPVLGRVLTSLVAGGGANFIADLFKRAPAPDAPGGRQE